jgi:hypothetical protein
LYSDSQYEQIEQPARAQKMPQTNAWSGFGKDSALFQELLFQELLFIINRSGQDSVTLCIIAQTKL